MRLLALSGLIVFLSAQSPIPRHEVKRAATPPTIDGKPDEPAWTAAPAVTLQFLWDHQTGAKRMARARLLWDAQALYVGFDADDADITAQFQQHDDPTYRDDAVETSPHQERVRWTPRSERSGIGITSRVSVKQ